MKNIIIIWIFALSILIQPVFAAPIDLPVGGRAQRMGGAYTAIADNSLAI